MHKYLYKLGVITVVRTCSPTTIRNGSVSLEGTSVGTIASYQCDEGYSLVRGHSVRICLKTFQWSGSQPICTCKCQFSIAHMRYVRIVYTFNALVYHSCLSPHMNKVTIKLSKLLNMLCRYDISVLM